MLKIKTSLVLGIIFCFTAFAQEVPQAQKNLMQFRGNWKSANIKIEMDGKTYTGPYTFDIKPVNMNTGILAYEKFENKELGTIESVDIAGYDPNLKQIHIYTVDNTGTAHDHFGYWVNNSRLFVQYQGVVDGKVYLEQINMEFKSPNEWELNLTGMLDGKTNIKISGTFYKSQTIGEKQ